MHLQPVAICPIARLPSASRLTLHDLKSLQKQFSPKLKKFENSIYQNVEKVIEIRLVTQADFKISIIIIKTCYPRHWFSTNGDEFHDFSKTLGVHCEGPGGRQPPREKGALRAPPATFLVFFCFSMFSNHF